MHEVIDLSEETDENVNGQRMTSVDPDYDLYQNSPKPGDLVFATLDYINTLHEGRTILAGPTSSWVQLSDLQGSISV